MTSKSESGVWSRDTRLGIPCLDVSIGHNKDQIATIAQSLEAQLLQAGQLSIHLNKDKALTSLTIHSGVSRYAVTNISVHLVNTRASV